MHARLKSSRQHRVVQLGSGVKAQDLQGPMSQCVLHFDEPLKMYCSDCARCICLVCYAEFHTGHRCQVDLARPRPTSESDAAYSGDSSQRYARNVNWLRKV